MAGQPIDRSESIYVENKQAAQPVDIDQIKRAAALVLDQEGYGEAEVTVSFVDSAEMAEMNEHYRGITGPTDVLSFSMTEQNAESPKLVTPQAEQILGDVIVCPEITAANAEGQGHSAERELLEITIHGLLHLLGYEHETAVAETAMIARQEELAGMIDET
jgi:probable rRNA maturation factor